MKNESDILKKVDRKSGGILINPVKRVRYYLIMKHGHTRLLKFIKRLVVR